MQRPAKSHPTGVLVGLVTTCVVGEVDGKGVVLGSQFRQGNRDVRKAVEVAHGNLPVLAQFRRVGREDLGKVRLRLKPCSQKGQGQAQENMPRVHLSFGLNGEFTDKLETSGCGNPQCIETGIPADGEKDRTIRRIETCGIVVSGRGSQ